MNLTISALSINFDYLSTAVINLTWLIWNFTLLFTERERPKKFLQKFEILSKDGEDSNRVPMK